jgi:phytanoyl-CoA hydroxylase
MQTTELVEACPAALTSEHLADYRRNGYLAFDGFLNAAEAQTYKTQMTEMVRKFYDEAKAGKLLLIRRNPPLVRGTSGELVKHNHAGHLIKHPDDAYAVEFEPEFDFDMGSVSFEVFDQGFRKIGRPSRAHSAFQALTENPRLIGFLESLIGPKPIVYGDQALCKPARIGSAKPWHQDGAYFHYEPYEAGVDVWIALDDAGVENGCMHVLPGGHLTGPRKHVHLEDCTVEPGRLDVSGAMPVELRAGGIMLFSTLLPHYTPANRSEHRRRALQFFYRAGHTRLVTPEEHAHCFVEADGTQAACSGIKN